jgi:glucose-6-phosphate dehydrogenase assembly protein OpcA
MSAATPERITLGQGEPVDLAGVESAFTTLWRQAGEQFAGNNESSVVRACLWNLVAYMPGPGADPQQVERLERMLADITQAVPSRVIRLQPREAGLAPAGAEVQAWVATHCMASQSGGGTVCAEEVTLAGYGDGGASHFPPLVRALRVPDLPVALLWLHGLPPKGRLVGQLMQTTDRMLVDSHFMTSAGSLIALRDLIRGVAAMGDLGWMRLTPMRYLIAKLFDPPGHGDNLSRLERIEVETTPDGLNEGFLLLGWLLSRAGYKEFKAVDLGGLDQRFRWQVRRGNTSFPIDLFTRPGYSAYDYDGILRLSIVAGGERYAMEQVDEEHVSLESSHHTQSRVALHGWEDAELIISALQVTGTDRIYVEALAVAAGLMDTEAWNR